MACAEIISDAVFVQSVAHLQQNVLQVMCFVFGYNLLFIDYGYFSGAWLACRSVSVINYNPKYSQDSGQAPPYAAYYKHPTTEKEVCSSRDMWETVIADKIQQMNF